MAATLSKAPVTFYFFVMVVMHLLTPNVYIGLKPEFFSGFSFAIA